MKLQAAQDGHSGTEFIPTLRNAPCNVHFGTRPGLRHNHDNQHQTDNIFYGKGRLNGTHLKKNKHDWRKVDPNGFSPLYKYENTKHENNSALDKKRTKKNTSKRVQMLKGYSSYGIVSISISG